jgi:predicted component of type VI protein secretion system
MKPAEHLAVREALERAGGGFSSWCIALLGLSAPITVTGFPLRGRSAPVSNTSLAFQAKSMHLDDSPAAELAPGARLVVSLYTLAGVGGPLPFFLSERMLTDKSNGGNGLHAFLDLLNLRTWELVLFRDIFGHDPRYIGFGPAHARRLDHLNHAMAKISVPEHLGAPPHLHSLLLQHGFSAGHLGGDTASLGAVLGSLLDCKVAVRRYIPVRLEVAERCAIGRIANTRLKRGQGLGARAWVAGGIDFVIQLDSPPESAQACDQLLERAHQCALVLLGAMASLVCFHIETPPSPSATLLGKVGNQLGRQALLGQGMGAHVTFRSKPKQGFTHNHKEFS